MRSCRRHVRLVLFVGAAMALIAGCGSEPTPQPAQQGASTQVSGTFASGTGPAFTYNPARVPVGAQGSVQVESSDASTRTTLTVSGLNPNSTYGAHAHAKPCGPTGDAAGPHYQRNQDPVTPSVDPAFANPTNEIWLDLKTDAQGAGSATSTVPWSFPADRRAMSVVVHDMATKTEPGKAGTAGSRPACIDVRF